MSQSQPKVALVTGASGVIGHGICSVLRREGFRVACCVRSPQRLQEVAEAFEKLTGQRFDSDGTFVADLTDLDRCQPVVQEVVDQMGPISLLVNNAVTNDKPVTLAEMTPEYLRTMSDVDFHAPLLLARAALPGLVQTRGSVVNISSVAVGWHWPGSTAYGALKAALEQATGAMASELAPQRVRVNAIRLGSVPNCWAAVQASRRLTSEQSRRMWNEVMPRFLEQPNWSALPRVGAASDVGEMIAFLASPRGEFINGAVINLDGGLLQQLGPTPPEKPTSLATLVDAWLAEHAPEVVRSRT